MWPANRARKKAAIITKVQIVRVMKVCFFLAYSAAASSCSLGSSCYWVKVLVSSRIALAYPEVVVYLSIIPFILRRPLSRFGSVVGRAREGAIGGFTRGALG